MLGCGPKDTFMGRREVGMSVIVIFLSSQTCLLNRRVPGRRPAFFSCPLLRADPSLSSGRLLVPEGFVDPLASEAVFGILTCHICSIYCFSPPRQRRVMQRAHSQPRQVCLPGELNMEHGHIELNKPPHNCCPPSSQLVSAKSTFIVTATSSTPIHHAFIRPSYQTTPLEDHRTYPHISTQLELRDQLRAQVSRLQSTTDDLNEVQGRYGLIGVGNTYIVFRISWEL
jgi:hypothetical protein